MDLQDRVALVTGGTGALGSAIVLELLASGAHVAVTYNVEAEWQRLLTRTGSNARFEGLKVDLTRAADVEAAARSLHDSRGRIDFLVATAGGFAGGSIQETPDSVWDNMLDLNLKTLISALRPLVPIMIKQHSGVVVTVSSGAIMSSPGAGIVAYAVSKGAVRQLSEILAEEGKANGIRVHCLMPGTMDTEANRRDMPDADPSQWVKTEEVARLVHRLLVNGAGAPLVVPILRPGDVLSWSGGTKP